MYIKQTDFQILVKEITDRRIEFKRNVIVFIQLFC